MRFRVMAIGQRLLPVLIIVSVLAPLLPLLLWSVTHRWYFPQVLPTAWSWRAWHYIFSPASQVGKALGFSTLVALLVTLLSVVVGMPAGRALALHQFRGKTIITFLILAPTIMPILAVAMGIHVAFIRYGLADTLAGVVLVHLVPVLPYLVLIMRSVFAHYDPDYEAQARTLGARPWQIFWHVTLPTVMPGVAVGALFAFIISWSQYLLTLVIGGGQVITLPVLLFAFANSGDNAIAAALSLVFIAPALLFLVLMTRFLGGRTAVIGGFGKL